MNIVLCENHSAPNQIGKTVNEMFSLTGQLVEGTNILSPKVRITGLPADDIASIDYAYIDTFKRWYFITNIMAELANSWIVEMRVDVLQTYETQIKNRSAIVSRNANMFNLYLNDGTFKVFQNPQIVTRTFPYGFSNYTYVLAVSGN